VKFALIPLLLASPVVFSVQTMQNFYEVEAIKCKDLKCVRNGIDGLNHKIVELLVQRTAYVQRAGDLKLHGTKIATDQKRIDDQINALRGEAKKLGLPETLVVETFKSIIRESTEFEQRYIDSKQE